MPLFAFCTNAPVLSLVSKDPLNEYTNLSQEFHTLKGLKKGLRLQGTKVQ